MRMINNIVAISLLIFTLSSVAMAQGEGNYSQITNAAWFDYSNDLNYSSRILDDYAHNNISDAEAIQSLMAVYTLAGRTASNIGSIEPPAEYTTYHSLTFNAIENFRLYLWNLSKFIETKYVVYGQDAMNYFNQSQEYRERALEESVIIQ